MPKLREPEAWLEIAERIASGHWKQKGLCSEVIQLFDDDLITTEMEIRMVRRVLDTMSADAPNLARTFAFPKGEADVRVLAALFLFLEANDELKGTRR